MDFPTLKAIFDEGQSNIIKVFFLNGLFTIIIKSW